MTDEQKIRELVQAYIPNDVYYEALSYDGCKVMLSEMAKYKNEFIKRLKSHADRMYNTMQNLSTDTTPIRKAMEDYKHFIFTEYYTN